MGRKEVRQPWNEAYFAAKPANGGQAGMAGCFSRDTFHSEIYSIEKVSHFSQRLSFQVADSEWLAEMLIHDGILLACRPICQG
jgi:hypothetical protein